MSNQFHNIKISAVSTQQKEGSSSNPAQLYTGTLVTGGTAGQNIVSLC